MDSRGHWRDNVYRHYIVVTDREMKEKIAQASHNQDWMLTAPVFIVCVAGIRARVDTNDDIPCIVPPFVLIGKGDTISSLDEGANRILIIAYLMKKYRSESLEMQKRLQQGARQGAEAGTAEALISISGNAQ